MEHHGIAAPLICPEKYSKATFFKGFDNADDETKGPDFNAMMFAMSDNRIVQPHLEAVEKLGPDLILADFASSFPLVVADKLQVPCVVNCPMPLTLSYMDKLPGITIKGNYQACCGCLCICPDAAIQGVQCMSACMKSKDQDNLGAIKLSTTIKNRAVLVNSFFGFEKPCSLPPNVTLTGPLVQPAPSVVDELAEKNPAVSEFLSSA